MEKITHTNDSFGKIKEKIIPQWTTITQYLWESILDGLIFGNLDLKSIDVGRADWLPDRWEVLRALHHLHVQTCCARSRRGPPVLRRYLQLYLLQLL